MFRDLPGHGYVLRGDYEIVDASMGSHLTFGIEHGWAAYWKRQNTLIETNRWETKVLPGSRLVMNAIEARNVAYSDSQLLPLPDKRCPRCQAMTYGSKRNGFLNWYEVVFLRFVNQSTLTYPSSGRLTYVLC